MSYRACDRKRFRGKGSKANERAVLKRRRTLLLPRSIILSRIFLRLKGKNATAATKIALSAYASAVLGIEASITVIYDAKREHRCTLSGANASQPNAMILYSDESVDGVMGSSGCLYETPLSFRLVA